MKNLSLSILLLLSLFTIGCQNQPEQKPADQKTSESQSQKSDSEKPVTKREPIIDKEGFTHLLLDDFEIFKGKQKKGAPEIKTPTWSTKEDLILCTGQPRGYLYTKKKYKNFVFELEIRYPESEKSPEELSDSNTGILVYITGDNRLWPVCLEVQGKQKEMGHIKANGRGDVIDAEKVQDNQKAREEARKKVGEWNHLKVISKDGKLISYLNGTKICENEPGELTEGFLGLQSERNSIEFRKIRIREE